MHDNMEAAYNEHQRNILKGILILNRSVAEYAQNLKSIDTTECPSVFRVAFREYVVSWTEFGDEVEKNSGLPAIANAYLTSGRSILEFWLIRAPEKVHAITRAKEKLIHFFFR